MSSYVNFSACKNELNSFNEHVKKDFTPNTKIVYDAYINKLIEKLWNIENIDTIEKINTMEELINFIVKNSDLKKITINLSDSKKNSDDFEINKLVDDAKYNTPDYFYYYQKPENQKKPLTHSQIFFLTTKVMPVHFYLNTALNEIYQSVYQFGKLLDCFIKIKGVPKFFESYFVQIGISGLQIIDIELVLGLVTNVLLFDIVDELKSVYSTEGENKGKIIKVNNIFDIIFRWKHIDFKSVFNSSTIEKITTTLKSKFNMDTIIHSLFKGFKPNERDECMKIYEAGAMSISVYLAYFIKNLKNTTAILSFSNLGYIDDLITMVIDNAKQKMTVQQGGDITIATGVFSLLKLIGIIRVVKYIANALKKPTMGCLREYYSNKPIDITKNSSFYYLRKGIIT